MARSAASGARPKLSTISATPASRGISRPATRAMTPATPSAWSAPGASPAAGSDASASRAALRVSRSTVVSADHPSGRNRASATSSGVSTPAVMYCTSTVAVFARKSASSEGVGCHRDGKVMAHPSGSAPRVGPSVPLRIMRTRYSARGLSTLLRSASTASYQLRASLSPVALSPAGLVPIRRVTGCSTAAAKSCTKRSRISGSPIRVPVSTRSKRSASASIRMARATPRDISISSMRRSKVFSPSSWAMIA